MRVIASPQFGIADADQTEESGNLRLHICKAGLVEAKSLGNLKSDGENRVQGGGGFLKDVGEFAAPRPAEIGIRAGQKIRAVLPDNLTG